MTTRFYLRNSQGSNPPVPITPNADAGWTVTADMTRVRILPGAAKANQAFADQLYADADVADQDIVVRQYIAPLKAGETITGAQALKFQMRGFERTTGGNMFTELGIRVIAADGTTVQKTVIAPTRDNTEMSTSAVNRQWTGTSAAGDYTIQQGDFLVIEIGAGGNPSGGGSPDHDFTFRLGDNNASDLPENDTSTTEANPWVELTDTLSIPDWVSMPSISSTAQLFAPTVANAPLELPHLSSTAVLNNPTVAYRVALPTIATSDGRPIDAYAVGTSEAALGSVGGVIRSGEGQSFTGASGVLKRATFRIRKENSPTGNIVAKLYAHSGTFGTSSVPTGAALATSDTIDVSTLGTSMSEVTFTFSSEVFLVEGTNYVIVMEYSDGNATDQVRVAVDGASPTHPGNRVSRADGVWGAFAGGDVRFSVVVASALFPQSLAQGAGDQSLSLPQISSTAAVTNPTLAYEVNLPAIASTVILNAPTLIQEQFVTLPQISSTASINQPSLAYQVDLPTVAATLVLNAPTITVGPVSLTLPQIGSAVAVNQPTLAYAVSLATIASAAVVNAPTLAYQLDLPVIGTTTTVNAPALAYEVNLPTVTSTLQLFPPVVSQGAQAVSLPTIASTLVVNQPTLTYQVDLPTIASTTVVSAPTLAYAVDLPTIASASTTFSPTLSYQIDLPSITSVALLFSPTLIPEQLVNLPHIGSTATVNAPDLAYEVNLPTIASTSNTFAPTLSYEVNLPTIASTLVVSQPTLAYQVDLPHISSTAQLFPPTVDQGGLVMPFISSTAALFLPTLAYAVSLPTITSGSASFTPTLSYQVDLPTITSTVTLSSPTLAYQVTLPLIGSAAQLFTPTVVAEGALSMPFMGSTANTFAPTLAYAVSLPTVSSTAQLFSPTVQLAGQNVSLPHVASTALVNPPSLSYGQLLGLAHIPSTSLLGPPSVEGTFPFITGELNLAGEGRATEYMASRR